MSSTSSVSFEPVRCAGGGCPSMDRNSEQSAVDVKRMRHADRGDLPDLGRSELGLDIDAPHVKRFPVYPDERSHVGVAARLGTRGAQTTVENELTPSDGERVIDRRRIDQPRWQVFDGSLRRRRFESHHGHVVGAGIRRHPAENTHLLIGAGFQHDGLSVREVGKNFEALRRRDNELLDRDRSREKTSVGRDDVKAAPVAEPQLVILRIGGIEKPQPYETGRNACDRRNRAVDNDGVASGAIDDIKRVKSFVVVFNRSVGVELPVLQDKRPRPRRTFAAIQAVRRNHHR